jgi:CD9 antigen
MTKIENELNCCGYDSNSPPDYVPTSLTVECLAKGRIGTCSTDKVVDKGWEDVEKQSAIVAGVAIGIGVVMLIGMIFALMLCCAIRDTM